MNLMGKILTVLILLSSVVFLTLALIIGASHQNWKDMAVKNKELAEDKHKETQSILASSKETAIQLRGERMARAHQVANLNAMHIAKATELDSKEKALSEAEKTMAEQTTQITQAQATIKNLDASIADLEKKNADMIDQISELRIAIVALTNDKYALQGTLQDLEVRQKNLSAMNAQMTKVMKANGLTLASLTAHVPPPVEGQVANVGENGFFSVSVGNDDGINLNHKLKIFRGEKYIGSADILNVSDNRLTARMIKDLQQDQLKKGDYVTTER